MINNQYTKRQILFFYRKAHKLNKSSYRNYLSFLKTAKKILILEIIKELTQISTQQPYFFSCICLCAAYGTANQSTLCCLLQSDRKYLKGFRCQLFFFLSLLFPTTTLLRFHVSTYFNKIIKNNRSYFNLSRFLIQILKL